MDYLSTTTGIIAGVDEAGRGPLAGPVVASAVILDLNKPIPGLNDSKKLSEKQRNNLFTQIKDTALAIGCAIIDHFIIDEINILNATKKAMMEAIEQLNPKPNLILIDAVSLSQLKIPFHPIIKGDSLSASIAAASIVAKVTRDQIMNDYHQLYPDYQFSQHKGYPTKNHISLLTQFGPCPIHRRSYAPVRKVIEKKN